MNQAWLLELIPGSHEPCRISPRTGQQSFVSHLAKRCSRYKSRHSEYGRAMQLRSQQASKLRIRYRVGCCNVVRTARVLSVEQEQDCADEILL